MAPASGVIGEAVGDNWEEWRGHLHYLDYLVVVAAIAGVVFALTSAYAFSRFEFPLKKAGLATMLISQMFPAVVTAVPFAVFGAILATWLRGLAAEKRGKYQLFVVFYLENLHHPERLTETQQKKAAAFAALAEQHPEWITLLTELPEVPAEEVEKWLHKVSRNGFAPEAPEVLGLAALLELQASRTAARTDAAGAPVLLAEQDRTRWDRLLIRRGLAALERAEALAAAHGEPLGPYALQAAIAACHARAPAAAATDWPRIAALYDALAQALPSPVVELNRAVAVAMAFGPAAGLEIVDRLAAEPRLAQYQWLPSVRGDLLEKLGRRAEARAEFERAAALAGNAREQALLQARAQRLLD